MAGLAGAPRIPRLGSHRGQFLPGCFVFSQRPSGPEGPVAPLGQLRASPSPSPRPLLP